jgi:uncharacterized membrane protein
MRKQTNHTDAFRQILILFVIVSWIAFLYFMLTGTSGKFFQVNTYGIAGTGIVNAFTTFIAAIFFSIILLLDFIYSRKK